jgi:hypothetical protein
MFSAPCRGESGELRVGVRRAMRQLSNVPSSVISSHSMHLGVLATAWHAINTKSMFTVYYKPRYVGMSTAILLSYLYSRIHSNCLMLALILGRALQSSLYLMISIWNLWKTIIPLGWGSECGLKGRRHQSKGNYWNYFPYKCGFLCVTSQSQQHEGIICNLMFFIVM